MRETPTLEFKERISNTFLKTVSAYANYGTGKILFGIADTGKAIGIEDTIAACLTIENKINDSLSPVPRYRLEVNPRSKVITLIVDEGLHKPYLYSGKAFRRSDTSTVEVDHLELTRLILEGQNLSFENTAARTQNLSFEYLEKCLQSEMGITALTDDTKKTLEILHDDTYNVAAELLADTNSFPGIDIARFGETISIFLDRQTYEHISVLEQYNQAINYFKHHYQYEEVQGSRREAKSLIPEDAFREAIANALVHRQWDVDAHIRISMHADRIEVSSPGGLPRGITEQEYLDGQISQFRNPILGGVFFRLHLIERFGTGVLRIKDAYSAFAQQPSFTVSDNAISVTLPVVREDLPLDADERAVYHILEGRLLPISEVSKLCGFGKTKSQQVLSRLVQKGYVHVVGNGRGTKYTTA